MCSFHAVAVALSCAYWSWVRPASRLCLSFFIQPPVHYLLKSFALSLLTSPFNSSVCLQCGRPGFDPWVGKIPWRRKWQPTPVFLPGESHGWRNLVGYSPRGRRESDTTEWLHFHFQGSVSRAKQRSEAWHKLGNRNHSLPFNICQPDSTIYAILLAAWFLIHSHYQFTPWKYTEFFFSSKVHSTRSLNNNLETFTLIQKIAST